MRLHSTSTSGSPKDSKFLLHSETFPAVFDLDDGRVRLDKAVIKCSWMRD